MIYSKDAPFASQGGFNLTTYSGGYMDGMVLLNRPQPPRSNSHVFKGIYYRQGAVLTLTVVVVVIKLRGLSPRANYTDRAAAAGRRS